MTKDTWFTFFEPFRRDLERHFVYHSNATWKTKLRVALAVEGIWAMAAYRARRAVKTVSPGVVKDVLELATDSAELAVRLSTGIRLSKDADIGPGFYIGHFGAITVGPGVRIGENSSIGQTCVVASANDAPDQAPVLGDRVYLGAGSKVLGPVRIDSGAAVGAGSTVMEDIPEDGVVVGVPARLVNRSGSGDFIYLGQGARPKSMSEPEAALEPRPTDEGAAATVRGGGLTV